MRFGRIFFLLFSALALLEGGALAQTADGEPAAADLAVAIATVDRQGDVGESFPYTITVTNAGPDAAAEVAVTDLLPTELTFVTADPSQGTCTGTTSVVCSLGSMGSGAEATVTLFVSGNRAATVNNSVSVSSTTSDPDGSDNTATSSAVTLIEGGSRGCGLVQAPKSLH